MSELGERLKLLMERSGVSSMRAFDRKAGTPVSLAAMILSGTRDVIRADTAKKYAAAYGCDWVWLYDGTGKPPRLKGRAA